MTISGRFPLYVVTGFVVPVLANERLFTKLDFQRNEGLETASSRLSGDIDSMDHRSTVAKSVFRAWAKISSIDKVSSIP